MNNSWTIRIEGAALQRQIPVDERTRLNNSWERATDITTQYWTLSVAIAWKERSEFLLTDASVRVQAHAESTERRRISVPKRQLHGPRRAVN